MASKNNKYQINSKSLHMMDYLRYYIVSLMMLIGIVGCLLGGYWLWAGISTYGVLFILALLSKPDHQPRVINHPLIADIPLYLHLILLMALFAAFSWRVGVGIGVPAGWPTVIALIGGIASLVWLSAAPNVPVMHELWHRRDTFSRYAGKFMTAFLADLHRDIPHTDTHHLHLGTPEDADTAYRGENVYHFMWRCTVHNYQTLWANEKKRRIALDMPFFNLKNLILWEIGIALLIPVTAGLIGGWKAAALVFLVQVITKFVVEALNYLQHYGLLRVPGSAIEVQHAWNHLNWWDRVVGYEITNHINHHRDGFLRFDQLIPDPDAPQMPNVFVCILCAFIPPLWFNLIAKPRLKNWDLHFANAAERQLAKDANRRAAWPDWLTE